MVGTIEILGYSTVMDEGPGLELGTGADSEKGRAEILVIFMGWWTHAIQRNGAKSREAVIMYGYM